VAAAKQVPCARLSEMTGSQKRADVLADNKLALNAGWDEGLLAIELDCLKSLTSRISPPTAIQKDGSRSSS
jgi:hypothetical protein